jgi:hypothetical protein
MHPEKANRFWTTSMFSSVAVSAGGSMLFVFVPILIDGLRHEGFSARDAGIVAACGTSGMFLGAIAALVATKLERTVVATAGALMLLVGCVGAALSGNLPALGGFALLAGTGGGLTMGVGHAAMSQTSAPERAYALFLVFQTLLASAIIMVLPWLKAVGHAPAFWASGAVIAAALPLIPALPKPMPKDLTDPPAATRLPISLSFSALIVATFFLWGVALLAIWSFAEEVADRNNIASSAFSQSLSVALIGGVIGAAMIVGIGRKWGRILPLLVIGSGYFIATIAFALPLTPLLFLMAAFAFQMGVQAPSYAFGALVEIDEFGRPGILYLLGLKAGFGVAPIVGALILERFSLPGLAAFSAASGVIAFVLFLVIINTAIPLIEKRNAVQGSS